MPNTADKDECAITLSRFRVQSVLKEAETIIEKENVIHLTRRDAAVFLAALRHPKKPNRKLRAAVKAYRQGSDCDSPVLDR